MNHIVRALLTSASGWRAPDVVYGVLRPSLATLLATDALHGSDDGELTAELLVDHEAQDAHHGRAAVVELHAALEGLRLLVEGVPAEVQGAVAEVAGEVARGGAVGGVLHDAELEEPDSEDKLGEAGLGDGVRAEEGREAVGVGVEGVPGVVNVAREVDAVAAVLDLDVTEAVEALLVGVVEEAEGVEEPER